jgi:anti-sigma factor ChrR (cupin superfamily)
MDDRQRKDWMIEQVLGRSAEGLLDDQPDAFANQNLGDPTLDEFATQLAQSPELQAEFSEFEAALHSMAYAAPLQPLAPDLKQRLLQRIGSTRPATAPGVANSIEIRSAELAPLLDWSLADLAAAAQALEWQPLPGMETGETAVWRIDRAANQVASFVRARGRDRFPAHLHAEGEVLLVISGDFSDGDRCYQQGDLLYSTAQSLHQPTTESGCLVLSISSLDDRLI